MTKTTPPQEQCSPQQVVHFFTSRGYKVEERSIRGLSKIVLEVVHSTMFLHGRSILQNNVHPSSRRRYGCISNISLHMQKISITFENKHKRPFLKNAKQEPLKSLGDPQPRCCTIKRTSWIVKPHLC